MSVPNERHLTWSNLVTYLEADAPAAIVISGTPEVRLIIEPSENRIAVRGPWSSAHEVPELTRYRHLDIRVGTDASGEWVELAVTGRHVLRGAYSMLTAIADFVQIDGREMGDAIQRAIESHQELLSALGRLSDHQELGLFGELLILGHLIGNVGAQAAVASWRGPISEEHDFGLDNIDLEIKTTLTEDRSHHISSLTQLEPSPDRELWLVSVQLTTTGVGGNTLPALIEHTSGLLSDLRLKMRFIEQLMHLGWDVNQGHLYTRRFAKRGPTLSYRVDESFPALTPRSLKLAELPVERFSRVSYVLHTAGLTPEPPPRELRDI
ncbi:PD-(D/E)XK motif protein [Candidatus Poriferisodalis sp.]|uniref:PD-(D/E)XK motif protein n=1 Tax=Candidatus Poriferisodalis sp. TaxID=3101277 RepID=UPI003B01AD86